MENVQDIVPVADLYLLTELKQHCEDFLFENAHIWDDVADVLNLASTFRLEKLKENLVKLVREDFELFCGTDSFLRTSGDVLLEILSGPYIVGCEDVVCLAVLRWLQSHNADHVIAEQMLHSVKLNEVCLSCLKRRVVESRCAGVRGVVLQLVKKEKQERERRSWDQIPLQWFVKRHLDKISICPPDKTGRPIGPTCECDSGGEVERIFFGCRGDGVSFDKHYGVVLDGRLRKKAEVSWRGPGFTYAACFYKNLLALCVVSYDCTVRLCDMKFRRWLPESKPLRERRNHGMVSVGDALYLVMGNNIVDLDTIAVYHSDTREWRRAGRMKIPTRKVAAAAVGNVIVASGSSGEHKLYQSFNTQNKEARVLHQDGFGLEEHLACSLGSGVAFAQKGLIICILLSETGAVTIAEKHYPDIQAALAMSSSMVLMSS